LLTLLNDLLDLARFEAHGMAFDFRENDIHQLVNTVAVELGGLLNTSKISLEVGEALDDGKLCCDETRILQVLRNLIANAIKVSPAGAQISVHFAQTEAPMGRRNSDSGMAAAIEVHVMDQGPGIPAEELELIFKKFVQSSKTKSRAGGTGLGLAICKQIVEAHGGLISAENRADGGAMFTLSLPRVTHPALAASLEAERLPEHEA
jgi:signal transduction histidine kinase